MNKTMRLVVLIAISGGLSNGAAAEVLRLKNGGRISGEIVRQDETKIVVRTDRGATIVVAKSRLAAPADRRELQYDKVAPTHADTVEGQLALAYWCKKKFLGDKANAHFQRVIELEPDHKPARFSLGYKKVDGRWILKRVWREQNGLRLYGREWLTSQEIELRERQNKNEQAHNEWVDKIKRWRTAAGKWKSNREKAIAGRDNLRAINDPNAVKTLSTYLEKEKYPQFKYWYIEALGKTASGAALTTLVVHSMNEEDEDICIACLEQLEHHKTPGVIRAFLKALGSKDNRLVNRAGLGLSYVGDKSVISPLIDALVTNHTFIIQKKQGGPGAMSATFQRPGSFGTTGGNRLGGSGLSMGGKPKRVKRDLKNREVHAALIALADGVDFSYDEKAWKHWLALQKKPNSLNARRD